MMNIFKFERLGNDVSKNFTKSMTDAQILSRVDFSWWDGMAAPKEKEHLTNVMHNVSWLLSYRFERSVECFVTNYPK